MIEHHQSKHSCPKQNGRHCTRDISIHAFSCSLLIQITMKYAKTSVDKMQSLFQIVDWYRRGEMPLSEPMDIYWRIYALLCLDELRLWLGSFDKGQAIICNGEDQVLRYKSVSEKELTKFAQRVKPRRCVTKVTIVTKYPLRMLRHHWHYPHQYVVLPPCIPDIGTTRAPFQYLITWWRHQMETFSALLAICAENSPVPGEFPAQRPVTQSFDVFFDLRLNKPLSKQSWGWWFETLWRPLWRHCNVSGSLPCRFGNNTIDPEPVKQPWKIWINTSHGCTAN